MTDNHSPAPPLVTLDDVSVARPGGPVVLRGVTWAPREGETWAVVGPMGSGKTTLAEVVFGRHRVTAGDIAWPLLDRLRAAGRAVAYPSEVIAFVAFKEDSRLFSYADHYYQQRFEFADADEPLTLDGYLRTGLAATDDEVAAVAARLGVGGLRNLSFIKLSNGQTRRARIARALLSHPALLILDDPFIGLDAAGRVELDALLGDLVRHGQRLMLVTRADAVPAWVTHVLELGRGGVSNCGMRNAECGVQTENGAAGPSPANPQSAIRIPQSSLDPVIELHHVTVTHGGKPILRDVSWTVRAGERWALVGPNGAGKTTLLSLVCGDHPQAYSNDVKLFGRQRGSGESVWDVKRKIGLVSPELHLYFGGPLSAAEVAVTGFHDVLAFREATPGQAAAVSELFAAFDLTHLAGRPFARLSAGEQRLVLLARALVKRPPLLVLDEPFQGFDAATVARVRGWLDRELRSDQTLVFVSHLAAELPATVTHRLDLADGRVAACGPVG